MIQLGPIVMPCRSCGVPPGHPCYRWFKGAKINMEQKFHAPRMRDAVRSSELLDAERTRADVTLSILPDEAQWATSVFEAFTNTQENATDEELRQGIWRKLNTIARSKR